MADAADAVAEVAGAETPVVEVPASTEAAPTETTTTTEAAPAEASTPAELAWIEEAGGADAVKAAWDFRQSLKTEEGVVDAFVEMGVTLGLTPQQMASLFPEQAAEALAEAEREAEEGSKPMTRREAEEYVQQLIADSVLAPLEAQQTAQATETIRGVVHTELAELKVPEEDRELLLRFADNHIAEEDRFDPAKVKAAIAAGAEDFDKYAKALVERRIAAKVKTNEGIPSPVSGGSTGGGEEQSEPMSLAEAKARVRAQYGGK
jgi:HEPN domain-containing protein